MRGPRRLPRRAPRRRGAGFTLVEVLIAMALLGLIAVGVLPLFTQSMRNNLSGNSSTQASNTALDFLEDASQVRFNAPEVTWATADTTLTQPPEYVELDLAPVYDTPPVWVTALTPGKQAAWTRQASLQQFSFGDLSDGTVTQAMATADTSLTIGEPYGRLDTPLAGTSPPAFVHLKQVDIVVRSANVFAPAYTVRLLKSY